MTIAEELSTISITTLTEYHKAGFKSFPWQKIAKPLM